MRRLRPGWAATLAALLLTAPLGALPPERTISISIRPALDRPGTRFDGWGTALAWFAEVTGGWPDADRQRLADLLYTPEGLGWSIARFNIGGGNAAGVTPYLRPGAAVPGLWRLPPGHDRPRLESRRRGDVGLVCRR